MNPSLLSLWLPFLPTDRIARAGTDEGGSGRVTVARVRGARRVEAADAAAAGGGVRPGMALAEARAVRPGLRAHPADPAGDAACLDALADWCDRFTPHVALDGADGLLLDLGGVAHLFGGMDALLAQVTAGVEALGFANRAAVAGTAEAAWAFARFGGPPIAPADREALRAAVAPLPLGALRLEPDALRVMEQAGLRQVGDLLCRPRAPLVARFGTVPLARLDALTGLARTPIGPRIPPPVFVVEARFASPVTLAADIERTLLLLAERLCALTGRHGEGARTIEARLFRVDGAVKRLAVGTSRPLTGAAAVARLFRERIAALGEEGLDTGYGFDLVRLGATRTEPVRPATPDLLAGAHPADRRQDRAPAPPRRDGPARRGPQEGLEAAGLAGLVDRFGARLGTRRVARLAARATHIPERASGTVSAMEAVAPALAAARLPADPARPIRLFARPEPIDTVAAVPDGPPMRFRWRRALHEVAAIEGPERIAPEWWREPGEVRARDYFRAEDAEGRQFWLFREGLFGIDPLPRWFLHGLFG